VSESRREIRDLPTALEALAEADALESKASEIRAPAIEFLLRFKEMVGGVPPEKKATPSTNGNGASPANRSHRPQVQIPPRTIGDRILTITSEAPRALMPKAIAEEYAKRGWPPPESDRSLNDALSSRISSLTKEGKLKRVADGYIHGGEQTEKETNK
jgi:hypothetical protein